MVTYTTIQLFYVAAAGAAVVILFWATGWPKALRENLFRRFLLTGVMVAGGGAVAFVSVAKVLGITLAFGLVALVFYGGALWLPVVTMFAARRPAKGRALAVLAALFCLATGIYSLFIEPNRLVLREEAIPVEDHAGRPFRLVHISDQQTVGECARERRAVEMINALDPDLIVITGDYVAGPFAHPEAGIAAARAFMGSLKAKHGVICVSGHSEPDRVRERVLEGLDVIFLKNQTRRFPLGGGRTLVIYGIDAIYPVLPREEVRQDPSEFVVIASHVPLYSRHMDGKGFDLHVAGHTHGGQIVIPGFGPPVTLSDLPRKYAHGLKRYGDHWLNVTSGIGMEGHHAPRVRFYCPPEVTLLRIGGGRESLTSAAGKE